MMCCGIVVNVFTPGSLLRSFYLWVSDVHQIGKIFAISSNTFSVPVPLLSFCNSNDMCQTGSLTGQFSAFQSFVSLLHLDRFWCYTFKFTDLSSAVSDLPLIPLSKIFFSDTVLSYLEVPFSSFLDSPFLFSLLDQISNRCFKVLVCSFCHSLISGCFSIQLFFAYSWVTLSSLYDSSNVL